MAFSESRPTDGVRAASGLRFINGLRFATLEWKNLVSSKGMVIVAVAIAVIPLLYGALYLVAFEDPYARLGSIPVAVVNEDRGATIGGERRVMGDEVVSSLKGASDGLGWHFVSAEEAKRGLKDGAYYMTCVIPEDFSAKIASAATSDPQQAQLLVTYDQGSNMLASQIGRTAWREVQDRVNAAVAREYWLTTFDKIAETSEQLKEASDGACELDSGLESAQAGSRTLTEKLGELSAGSADLASGLDRMRQAVDGLPERLTAMKSEADALGGDAVAALVGASAGLREVEAGLAALATTADEADAAAIREIVDGLAEIRSQMDAAAPSLAAGVDRLLASAEGLSAEVPELVSGVDAAAVGAHQVHEGTVLLEKGSAELEEGLATAVGGAGDLASRLEAGAEEAAEQSANADGKAQMMSAPVALTETYFTSVRNYGTGFAPYFMALALWVGSLVAGFVFKPLNGRLVLSGVSPTTAALANYLPMALFACIQATLLMLVVQFVLKLQVDDVTGFYVVGYATALVFAAIMQLLAAALGVPGRFVAIILLMLQLTSSAGTFPVQTTPQFFQVISPFMPMTYVVEAFRQVTAGADHAAVVYCLGVLFGMGLLCFALTCLVAHAKRTVRMDDLHPLISLS